MVVNYQLYAFLDNKSCRCRSLPSNFGSGLHSLVLQDWVSLSHTLLSCVQPLVLNWVPLPQVSVHSLHSVHSEVVTAEKEHVDNYIPLSVWESGLTSITRSVWITILYYNIGALAVIPILTLSTSIPCASLTGLATVTPASPVRPSGDWTETHRVHWKLVKL